MAEISGADLQSLWQSGYPLHSTWLGFAKTEQRAKWDELKTKSAIQALSDSVKDAPRPDEPNPLTDVGAMQRLLQPAQTIVQARLDLKKEMQSNILAYLKDERLFAYGFEPPRKLSSIPVPLPRESWSGVYDWDESAIKYAGLDFVQVRLITREARNEILGAREPSPVVNPPLKGRPSVAPQILVAAQAMLASGQIDISRSAKSHFQEIRNWLRGNAQDLPVAPDEINDETIRRVFAPVFNELKQSKKQ